MGTYLDLCFNSKQWKLDLYFRLSISFPKLSPIQNLTFLHIIMEVEGKFLAEEGREENFLDFLQNLFHRWRKATTTECAPAKMCLHFPCSTNLCKKRKKTFSEIQKETVSVINVSECPRNTQNKHQIWSRTWLD